MSEQTPPGGGGGVQVTIGALAVWRQNIKKMFLESFCDVLHNKRPDFDLAVLLRRWWISFFP